MPSRRWRSVGGARLALTCRRRRQQAPKARRHNSPAQRAGFGKSQRARAESPAQKTPAKKAPVQKRRCSPATAPLALMVFHIRFPWAAPKAVMPSRRWRSAGIGAPAPVTHSGACLLDGNPFPRFMRAMPQSLSLVLLHVIFSTKNRRPLLVKTLRTEMFAYLSGVAREMSCECFRVGGVADHVHLAVTLPRTVTQAQLVEELKTASSRWAKTRDDASEKFSWQRGYGCFSVSPPALPSLCDYIDRQEEHHKTRTFQDEYREFLRQYNVAYDERYVWD
jgi:REP element-mobilizing transposase RayT